MSPGLNIGSSGSLNDETAESEAAHPSQPGSSRSLSRSASRSMRPPPLPHSPSSSGGSGLGDNTGVGSGPGPLRHPRPMTISDIHLELEKEQEAVVNRLTRELSLLRAQTASVASTASSASTNINEQGDGVTYNAVSSPRTRSRHRSSSTLSSRSIGGTYVPGSAVAALTSIVPSRDNGASSSRQSIDLQRPSISREVSASSPRLPEVSSPLLLSPQCPGELSRPSSTREHRSESVSSTSRYEEVARHRAELEVVKRENESLRRRVRELEKILRERRNV
ncbi:hypothetical protein MferCBS31731_003017 [Microsporum ferrugineum]